jgi:hypothetical protein
MSGIPLLMSGKALLKYSGLRDQVRVRRQGKWFTPKSRADLTIGYRPNPNNHDKRVNIIILFTGNWDGSSSQGTDRYPGT